MNEVTGILNIVLKYGVPGALVIAFLIVLHKPERLDAFRASLLLPLFRLFKWGSKQYIASKVSSTTTRFMNSYLAQEIPSLNEVTIRVKWVNSPSDPVLTDDGTVVLRMRNTNDQTKNALMATRLAIPHIVCPTIRGNLDSITEVAMDLTILHRLADRLGKHARPVFQRCFLAPELEKTTEISNLFKQFVELDYSGLFTVIFLEELWLLGEDLYTAGDTRDRSEAVRAFLEFLLGIVRREHHAHVQLDYCSPDFNVGVILLAESRKAETEGVLPYVSRVDKIIKLGCDSIYIISFPAASSFLRRVIKAIEGDDRLSLVDHCKVRRGQQRLEGDGFSEIAFLSVNKVFVNTAFPERLKVSGLSEGDIAEGTVIDVAKTAALVDVQGMNGVVSIAQSAWHAVHDCREVMAPQNRRNFLIISIDQERKRLLLSRRLPQDDPWHSKEIPEVGERINATIVSAHSRYLFANLDSGIEVRIARDDLAWLENQCPTDDELIGSTRAVVVCARDDINRGITCSLKLAEPDPWPDIHKAFPPGTPFRATVVEVGSELVIVDLPEGLSGIIPGEALRRAGHEYTDYENTLVPGQGLDVVVSKIFLKKRKIRLDLSRNA